MARIETVLSVFVASPGDVSDARKKLDRVVDELNFLWSREFGIRLELVKWETHAYSDAGIDAQQVINEQLDQFDIFLGIMWKKFGEPTGRAESGTQEEFSRAVTRHKQEPSRVRVMFYFKDAPPGRLSAIDTKQLDAVNQFQNDVGNAGVLYFNYKSMNEFESLVRQHLSRQVQAWGKSWGGVVDDAKSIRPVRRDLRPEEAATEPPSAGQARAITAIVFEQMAFFDKLVQRSQHDPDVLHRSFLEAQVILDSSLERDDWGKLAAQQAAALVVVALANRLEGGDSTRTYLARVCNRILSLRGMWIDWQSANKCELYDLASSAQDRHDDDMLLWIKQHAVDSSS